MQFENVTVMVEGNSYFDGAVTSRTILFHDGSKKTLGFMQVGEYEFGTDAPELMEITSGEVEVLLPHAKEWQTIQAGESFEVAGSSRFKIKVHSISDYCCSYL